MSADEHAAAAAAEEQAGHIARNSAIGHEQSSSEMPFCPLTLRGASARVRSVGDGFAVAVRADDDATAREILRRAESLRANSVATR